jgi:glucosylceramidase
MLNKSKSILTACLSVIFYIGAYAQSYTWIYSTEGKPWKKDEGVLQKKASMLPMLEIIGSENFIEFKGWGTCFNELGWDALKLLSDEDQENILNQLFSPEGDLRLSIGRFSMNANDYARNWYSCDEVDGDFQLKYFNIERDKTTLIPFIKAAQKYNPNMTFWISPWSPPSWMKVNHYYSVKSNVKYNKMAPESDFILFEDKTEKDPKVFPQQLAVNDYLIQDPRYLKAYANYFCKFISAYKDQGIPITKAMFQNESWSYTVYPGCAWTPEGIIQFNTQYLAPALREQHPKVSLYLGTINTNRFDFIDKVLSDSLMSKTIHGIGLQWEGGQILSRLRNKYPQYKYMQSESECGWGSFDWKAAEHTFSLINHYLGNGCEEYTFWNAILSDEGLSGWGWKQNALIRVDSKTKTATYTPEYYAVKHYSHFIAPGSRILAFKEDKETKVPILIISSPDDKVIVIAGNFNEKSKEISVKLGVRYLNVILQPHSLNTFKIE